MAQSQGLGRIGNDDNRANDTRCSMSWDMEKRCHFDMRMRLPFFFQKPLVKASCVIS